MRPLALLLAVLALPAAAQVVPDEFPDPSDSFADRVQRELVERHRPFLSGLYATSAFAVGPQIGQPDLIGAASAEGGYRFASGHALALSTTLRSPLARSPISGGPEAGVTASLGAEAVFALGRGADRASMLRGAELGVGLAASLVETREGVFTGMPTVSLSPRVAIPLSPITAIPVGLRVSQELSADAPSGPYVGVTLGFRRLWADKARMVLE